MFEIKGMNPKRGTGEAYLCLNPHEVSNAPSHIFALISEQVAILC